MLLGKSSFKLTKIPYLTGEIWSNTVSILEMINHVILTSDCIKRTLYKVKVSSNQSNMYEAL